MAGPVADAVTAIRAGQPVLLPTDTVYGLCCDPSSAAAVQRLARLKQRDERQPIALLAAGVERLRELLPELAGATVLPGPYTLILPNPARRFPWLTGTAPETIGVRVPELPPAARAVLDEVGVVAATSANLHGGPDPRQLADVPDAIRSACGAEVDAGELPGLASTVLDLTGDEPRVLREGAGDVAAALRLLA